MSTIHPTALVDRQVEIGQAVQIDAFAVVQGRVALGEGTVVGHHSIIKGSTIVGANCRIGPAAWVGLDPQHLQFDSSSETWLTIGEGTIIREGASAHRATKPGIENATRIGKQCFLMGASHVGHDCQVADRVVMANGVLLGGHCEIGERAFLGGGCAIHQFCKIGRLVVVSGNEIVTRDVPPFSAVRYGGLKGYNAVGCRRGGLSHEAIHAIHAAFHCLHTHRLTSDAVRAIQALNSNATEVKEILDFIPTSRRGLQPSVRFIARMRQGEDADD